jgi:hypothetical protein
MIEKFGGEGEGWDVWKEIFGGMGGGIGGMFDEVWR